MRASVWKTFAILASATLLSGCGTKISSVVATPDLYQYAPEIQQRAANELTDLGPPCPRTTFVAGCSAVKTMVMDYGKVRDQIRAAKK